MEIQVLENGAWVGKIFVPFNQSMECIINKVVEAASEQSCPATAEEAFKAATRILKRSSSSIPVPKLVK